MEKGVPEEKSRASMYIEEYLFKRECDKKWVKYWVTLHGKCMMFYSHQYDPDEKRDAFRGFIELTSNTRCLVSKRKKYSFPFFVSTEKSKYYFKCPSPLQRHQWIYAIESSIQGKQPSIIPGHLGLFKNNAVDDEDIGIIADSSLVNTEDSVRETLSDDISLDDEYNNDSEIGSDRGEPRVILVASQPSHHKITNFLGENHSLARHNKGLENDELPDRTLETTREVKRHTVSKINSPRITNLRQTMESESKTQLSLPAKKVVTADHSRNSDHSNERLHSRATDNTTALRKEETEHSNPIQSIPNYHQCGRYVLTTNVTGVTKVDLGKERPLPLASTSSPVFSKAGTGWRSRMVRSADGPRNRPSVSFLGPRPRSQGNTSDSRPKEGFASAVNSRYSRHLTTSSLE